MTPSDLRGGVSREAAEARDSLTRSTTSRIANDLSKRRHEPEWMLRLRLRASGRVQSAGIPSWAAFLSDVDFENMVDADASAPPAVIAQTPALAPGLTALEESENAYRAVRDQLARQGVVFCGLSTALARSADLVKRHFGSVVSVDDHPIASLNAALWTGGSFVYVPPGVRVEVPLQAEIREDYAKVEPFERNIVVADRGSEVTYIEGCTAPVYTPDQLHVSAIEVVAMAGSRVRYIALQNFAKEVDNLVTKRALVHEGASVEWIDANLGSRRTWKVPRADLLGPGASAEFVGVSFAGSGQCEEVGAEMVHAAPRTRSRISNHGIVRRGGRATLRSGVTVSPGATGVRSSVEWSSLMLDAESRSETLPSIELDEADATITQEGAVRKVDDEMLFYMASRGVTKDEAIRMVVLGTAEIVTRCIPVEYAVEVDRLLELELGGGIG
ncbi:MAG TPA: Fe-S cluster assembly protein SufB [Thermoplasmata archaeon]|nr:Fe-S cluster assembly protein SufB [Thermoplasmata archaeon]